MTNWQWKEFLRICRDVCGVGSPVAVVSQSWCAFTTFGSLETYLTYWQIGFPDENDLLEFHTRDGGVWGQPFYYNDLAHIVVPKQFRWEVTLGGAFTEGYRYQDIDTLSKQLNDASLPYRLTEKILELKLY